MNTIIKISSKVVDKKNKQTWSERYYISSAKEYNTRTRDHWAVENNLH